jgi:hypothetical protein
VPESHDRSSKPRVAGEASGLPARGYSWPPFSPGHALSERHRSYVSELKLSNDERVAELASSIAETQPVSHPADAGAIWRLALVYRRLELSAAALDDADASLAQRPLAAYRDGVGFLERLRRDHRAWLREAGGIEAELARTPASRARLGLHLALGRRALTVVELHEAAAREEDGAA